MRYVDWGVRGLVVVAGLLVLAAIVPMPGQAQVSVLNYFATATGRDNILNIDGTLEFEDKATVLDHGTATTNASGYVSVTTNLSSTVTCVLALNRTAPGDDPVMVTGIWTTGGAVLEILAWQNTSGTDPTLIASTVGSVKVGYICAGAD